MCVCVCVCVRACVRVCMRACVRGCVCVTMPDSFHKQENLSSCMHSNACRCNVTLALVELQVYFEHTYFFALEIQWNLCIMDTLEPTTKSFYMIKCHLVPQLSVWIMQVLVLSNIPVM